MEAAILGAGCAPRQEPPAEDDRRYRAAKAERRDPGRLQPGDAAAAGRGGRIRPSHPMSARVTGATRAGSIIGGRERPHKEPSRRYMRTRSIDAGDSGYDPITYDEDYLASFN